MQNQLIKLFLIVSVLIGFCQVANEASAVQVNVNLLNSEFPEVNDIPNSLNHKNGKAYPIEFGYCQPLEFSVFIPKDFGEIMLQDGKEVFKVPYIKAIHTKQDQIVYSGPASFNYEDSENVKLSSEASMRVPLYSLLDGLPIRHTQEGKLTITKIGAFDPGTDREISPKDAPKSLITAMKKIAGKCLVIRGDIYLSMVASPDYSYTIYTSIAIKRGNGSEEISNPVALSFVTYGRRFVLVDGESRAFDDNEIKFIVQNRNPGSNNYEKYLAHDLKTGMNFWTSNKNDSKIKEFSPTSSGEFSVKGIVGYFDLIQIGKTTQYNNYDVGIPFHTTAGTYTTSAGSLDYLQVNGSKAEHARQMIEFLPNEGEVPSFHASTKYVIIAIGIFIIIIFAYFLDLIRK